MLVGNSVEGPGEERRKRRKERETETQVRVGHAVHISIDARALRFPGFGCAQAASSSELLWTRLTKRRIRADGLRTFTTVGRLGGLGRSVVFSFARVEDVSCVERLVAREAREARKGRGYGR